MSGRLLKRIGKQVAAKAVVLIDPQNRAGEIAWAADGHAS
jgi:hypothetical protein